VYLKVVDFGSRHRYDAVLTLADHGRGGTGDGGAARASCNATAGGAVDHERRRTEAGADLAYRLLLRNPSRDGELKAETGPNARIGTGLAVSAKR